MIFQSAEIVLYTKYGFYQLFFIAETFEKTFS
jgi:hypothetical protein